MEHSVILFDLDGTLTDPGPGITNSVAYALGKFGIPVTDRRSLYRFIGPPLLDAFREYYGFDRERSVQALTYYREYFADRGIFENTVYDGIPEMLDVLKAGGKRLAVATSKPEPYALRIMDHFGLSDYFEFVCGSNMDETRSKKSEVIHYALERMGVTDKTSAIMVGDREHDVRGAAEAGLPCVGVLFGYGSREELERAGAAALAETVADLPGLLL